MALGKGVRLAEAPQLPLAIGGSVGASGLNIHNAYPVCNLL